MKAYQKLKKGAKLKYLAWTDPNTGYTIRTKQGPEGTSELKSIDELLEAIKKHREQRKLPEIEDLRDIVQAELCSKSANLGACEDASYPIKIKNKIQGLRTLTDHILRGVRPSLNDRTNAAYKCGNCPFNTGVQREGKTTMPVVNQTTPEDMDKIIQRQVSIYELKYPSRYQGAQCMACGGCHLTLKLGTDVLSNLRKLSKSKLLGLKEKITFVNGMKAHCPVIEKGLQSPEGKKIIESAWK